MQCASYAKINLFLEVRDKLPDGYHQVETLLCSIDLCDTIKYTLTKNRGIKLWSNTPELAAEDNIVHQVASYLNTVFHPSMGIEIDLEKRIPLAAGLGGGSSNAANTLLALNILWNLSLRPAELNEVAASFGSDLNFFLNGGTAWGTNRGEQIAELPDLLVDNILLVNPGIAISSAHAYRLVEIPSASMSKHWSGMQSCFNRLEAGIRDEFPIVDEIIAVLKRYNANPALMSGSGSTCFGIFDKAEDLQLCEKYFNSIGYWTYSTNTISREQYQSVFKT